MPGMLAKRSPLASSPGQCNWVIVRGSTWTCLAPSSPVPRHFSVRAPYAQTKFRTRLGWGFCPLKGMQTILAQLADKCSSGRAG